MTPCIEYLTDRLFSNSLKIVSLCDTKHVTVKSDQNVLLALIVALSQLVEKQ